MGDNDGELKLGVTLDGDGADDGLRRLGSSAHETKGELEKLSESTHSLQGEQLGSLRTAHHFVEGLIEIQEGGPAAAAGVAMLTRIITEMGAEAALGPLGPIVLVLSTLTAVAIPVLERAFTDSGKKAKEATDGVTGSLTNMGRQSETTRDQVTHAVDEMVEHENVLEAASKRQLDLLKDRATATKELLEANKRNAIEAARQQYLAGIKPEMSDEELERRRKQFEAQQQDIEGESTVKVAQLDRDEALQALSAAQQELAQLKQSRRENTETESDAQDVSATARNFFAGHQYQVTPATKEGESPTVTDSKGKDVIAQLEKKLAESEAQFRDAQQKAGNDPTWLAYRDAVGRRINTLEVQLADIRNNARALDTDKATQARLGPQDKDLDAKIAAAYDKIDQSKAELDVKSKEADAALAKQLNDRLERTFNTIRSAAKDAAEKDYNDTRGALEAAIAGTQSDLDTKPLTDDQRSYAEKSIGQMKSDIAKLQAAYRAKFHDVTPGEQEQAGAEEAGDIAAGNKKAAAITDKAAGVTAGTPEYDAAASRLSDLVAWGMKQAVDTNNAQLVTLLKTAPDDRSRGELLQNLYQDSSDPAKRGLATNIGGALTDENNAKNITSQNEASVAAATNRINDLTNQIGGQALADGLQKLFATTQSHGDMQTKINAVILQAQASTDVRIQTLAQQLVVAEAQLQKHGDKLSYPNNAN